MSRGVPLAAFCSQCGAAVEPTARFCSSCGAAVAAASPAASPASSARKERKFATALFVDVVGSTSLNERADPEIVQLVIGRTFDRLREEVEAYGGFLEKFIGDAILAVFGIPKAHEDDPERAVRAALRMQELAVEIREQFEAEGKPGVTLRIGVEAGEVLVDVQRVADEQHRMLTGDAVNTAARLESAAPPDEVLVGPVVHAATRHAITYESAGALELKGKAQPLPAWRPVAVQARRARWGARGGRLVGRDRELEQIDAVLARAASEERPTLLTVTGEPGIGKTRLVEEAYARSRRGGARWRWRSGRCVAYGGTAYSAFADVVKQHCGIFETDSVAVARRKIDKTVSAFEVEGDLVDPLLALVGHGSEGFEAVLALVGASEQRLSRDQLFAAWTRFVEGMAQEGPLVLVQEDVHWADTGLLDFLEHLALVARGPVVLLCMARAELTERRPSWADSEAGRVHVGLQPLAPDNVGQLLAARFEGTLPDALVALVLERCGGNPLFAEELVQMLVDRGALRHEDSRWQLDGELADVDVPNSVHAIASARLDALPIGTKLVLQDASVVGDRFWEGAVGAAAGAATSVGPALDDAVARTTIEPVEPSTFEDEDEYGFRHVLFREVAYESLPKLDRAAKHRTVAGWVRDRVVDRDDIVELVATHYTQAVAYLRELSPTEASGGELPQEAYRWSRRAGDRALWLWQLDEAVRWYRTALDLAEAAGVDAQDVASLTESFANAAVGVLPYEEVLAAFADAATGYERLGAEEALGRVHAAEAYAAFRAGDLDVLHDSLDLALAILRPLGPVAPLGRALHTLGSMHGRLGEYDQAEPALREAAEVARQAGDPTTEGRALMGLGMVMCDDDQRWEAGVEHLRRAHEIATDVRDLELLLSTLHNLPTALVERLGDHDAATDLVRQGLELAVRSGKTDYEASQRTNLGRIALLSGDTEAASTHFEAAANLFERIGELPWLGVVALERSRVAVLRGHTAEAVRLEREGLELMPGAMLSDLEVEVALLDAAVLAARGDGEGAIALLTERVEQLEDRLAHTGAIRLPLELLRSLVRADHLVPSGLLDMIVGVSAGVPAEAYAAWARGLAAAGDEAVGCLLDAAERFSIMPRRIDQARCLLDAARVERVRGRDGRAHAEQAAEILAACGVVLHQAEVDRELGA